MFVAAVAMNMNKYELESMRVQPGERAAKSLAPQNRPTTDVSIKDIMGGAIQRAKVGATNLRTVMGARVGTTAVVVVVLTCLENDTMAGSTKSSKGTETSTLSSDSTRSLNSNVFSPTPKPSIRVSVAVMSSASVSLLLRAVIFKV
jgi:hypothetical protein